MVTRDAHWHGGGGTMIRPTPFAKFVSEYQRQLANLYPIIMPSPEPTARVYCSTDGSWPVPESEMDDLTRILRDQFYEQKFSDMFNEQDRDFLASCGRTVESLERLTVTNAALDILWDQLLDNHTELHNHLEGESQQ